MAKSKDQRTLTQDFVYWNIGMEMSAPSTGYSPEQIGDLIDDISDPREIPAPGKGWIIEQANGDVHVAEELTQQALRALP